MNCPASGARVSGPEQVQEGFVTQLIEVQIGGQSLYIQPQPVGDPIEILGDTKEPRVAHTGVKHGLERAYTKAKSIILALAADFDKDVRNLPKGQGPTAIDVEFSLSFSAQANAWVIGAQSDSALNIKFTWTRDDDPG